MDYIPRHIAPLLHRSAQTFPVTMVTGPRQVGKTTLLSREHPCAEYVTFDRLDALEAAREEPERFLRSLGKPAIIDEVQYCPDLFRYIKMQADASKEKGILFLTGSQRFQMMQGVDESLAGRAAIVEMLGLSLREMARDGFDEPFVPTEDFIRARRPRPLREDVWQIAFRGDLPELAAEPSMDASLYYASYIEAYLNRDVRDLAHVGDLSKFKRFLRIAATYHGRILNKTALASECDLSFQTVERWLGVLEASSVIYLLRPFSANMKKRLVKSPKLYFLNSGVLVSLLGIESGDALARSDQAGAVFEGLVVAEVIKSFLNRTGSMPDLCYYRDSNGKEIDLVIERGKDLFPVEAKKAERARPSDARAFMVLDEVKGRRRRGGVVVCSPEPGPDAARPLPLPDGAWSLPITYL